MSRGKQYRWTKAEIIEAIEKCDGTQKGLAKCLGCKGELTAMKRLDEFQGLRELFRKKKAQIIEVAENTVLDCLNSKNDAVRLKAGQFILTTLGKDKYNTIDPKVDNQDRLIAMMDKLIDKSIGE